MSQFDSRNKISSETLPFGNSNNSSLTKFTENSYFPKITASLALFVVLLSACTGKPKSQTNSNINNKNANSERLMREVQSPALPTPTPNPTLQALKEEKVKSLKDITQFYEDCSEILEEDYRIHIVNKGSKTLPELNKIEARQVKTLNSFNSSKSSFVKFVGGVFDNLAKSEDPKTLERAKEFSGQLETFLLTSKEEYRNSLRKGFQNISSYDPMIIREILEPTTSEWISSIPANFRNFLSNKNKTTPSFDTFLAARLPNKNEEVTTLTDITSETNRTEQNSNKSQTVPSSKETITLKDKSPSEKQ